MSIYTTHKHTYITGTISIRHKMIHLFIILLYCMSVTRMAVCHGDMYSKAFITRKESSTFLEARRDKRDINCAGEGVCEANKDLCRKESDREVWCRGKTCPAGQFCQLTTPCPKHFQTACIDFNECQSTPCKNGAMCHNGNNTYTCTCTPGWTGSNCNTDINECQSNPCHNGATCNNGRNTYTCTCAAGWIGSTCTIDYDECQGNPCQNGATCHNGNNAYTCTCNPGWTGSNCNTDINECQSNPCKNGATCDNGQNTYTCNCAPGWLGSICNTDYDECKSNPCQNGATCNNGQNAYTCICMPGWTGNNCHLDYDECQSDPCQNGATCKNGQNAYTCSCMPGWIGDNCHLDYNECQSNPCQNRATCNNGQNAYTCICMPGWIGENCNLDVDECQSNPCQNGATCVNGRNAFMCICIAGWIGINCDTDYDECQSSPCANGGSCNNLLNLYTCTCLLGWIGLRCETDFNECDSSPCQNGASCINGQNEYECICTPGWEGINCETETDECLSNPCQNNATCNDLLNKYSCTCAEDFTGVNCEVDMCIPHHPAGADVVFILDLSLSQSATAFQRQKDYIKEFIISFPIGVDDFQFSVVSFSFDATVHSYLNSSTTHEALIHAVDNIKHIAGPSYTGKALEIVRKDVLTPDKGARSVYHYVIVLTNGLSSNRKDTIYQATQLKLDGAHVIAVAIGDQVAHEELINIASDSSKVFPATNKDALNSILKSHVMATCPDCFRNTSDIAVLMDASKDLDQQSNLFYKQLNALKILLKAIPISKNGVHVSYTRFGKSISEEFDFDDYTTYAEVSEQITKVSRLERIEGSANVTKALNYLYQHGFLSTKGRRPNARKMAIIFTNGKFDDTDAVKEEVKQLKKSGVTMVTVGTGRDANITSLLEIASDPAFVYIVGEDMYTDLTVLYSLVGALEYDVCEFD